MWGQAARLPPGHHAGTVSRSLPTGHAGADVEEALGLKELAVGRCPPYRELPPSMTMSPGSR
jgi:hypothetical protein